MASNAIADHYRQESREISWQQPEITDDEIVSAERRDLLARSVDRLPAEQRRVILMRFIEEQSIREIAEQMGKSEGAIKQLQWRAMQNLRAQMKNG